MGDPVTVTYDAIGGGYDGTRRPDPRITERLLKHLRAKPDGRYLDLACGTGNYTLSLVASGLGLVGVDQSETMLRVARDKAPHIEWHRADAAALPFPDRSFQGAICTLAIHHFPDLIAGFAEVQRVMERGRFVILTAMPEQMRRYWLNAYFPVALSRSIKQMPAREAVTTALDAAGFKLLEIEPWAVPPDPSDLFLYSGKHRPELYLDPDVRKGISTFARLASAREVEAGLTRLRSDLGSGHFVEVAARYEHDGGDYSFVVAEKMGTRQ